MHDIDEFCRSCSELSLSSRVIDPDASRRFLNDLWARFGPARTSGHPSLSEAAVTVPVAPHEFSFPDLLDREAVYVFFRQDRGDKDRVVVLDDGRQLGSVLENAFGMEYFVSNERQSYLLCVNWYVIEGAGAIPWLEKLAAPA